MMGAMKTIVCFLMLAFSLAEGAKLSDSMSLNEIEQAMTSFPPSWKHGDQRAFIARSLDKIVCVQARDSMTDADRAQLQPLLAFYRRCVDRGLDSLERTQVKDGVLVVKFYSSSFVLKSAAGTVAIDFCQGPINNGGEPEERDTRRTGFFMTPAQRDRLARLVDVSLITHRHHDHSDYSLSKRLAARGKPVVGPAQLKTLWKDLADKIAVPTYETAQRLGPVEFYTMRGSQCSKSEQSADGKRLGVPNTSNPNADTETVVYIFRVGGIAFFQAAENHIPADAWLRKAIGLGFRPQVLMSAGQYQGGSSARSVLNNLKCLTLPLHEYELMHEGGGNRTTPWFSGTARSQGTMPLFWGESFLLTHGIVKASSSR